MSIILTTPQLRLREFNTDDARFILDLVNDPDWIRFIGDKGIRDLAAARAYLEDGLMAHYAEHGFGLWAVEPADGDQPVGMCGLVQRDHLPDPDLGFAFQPAARGSGLATAAARATVAHAFGTLGLQRLLAITSPDNNASMALLARLGFAADGVVDAPVNDQPLKLWRLSAP